MNVDEIFAAISARMIEGMMYHDQMTRYYSFLGLKGYQYMHEYHFAEETMGLRDVNAYYTDHYCKLIPERRVSDPSKIPQGWYSHVRRDVDPATRKKAIQTASEDWVAWEIETKGLYEKAACDLLDLGEMPAYAKVMEYVNDVSDETACARDELLALEATGYDLPFIVDRQTYLKDKFCKKLRCLSWKNGV